MGSGLMLGFFEEINVILFSVYFWKRRFEVNVEFYFLNFLYLFVIRNLFNF